MKHILLFNTSNSSTSINGKLLQAAAALLHGYGTTIKSVRDFPLPFFSEDAEKTGFPAELEQFFAELDHYDAFVFSCAEHNGGVPAEFKNLFDWATRYPRGDKKIFSGKPLLILSTSPGVRGAKNAAKWLADMAAYYHADIVGTHSLGSFYQHFVDGTPDGESKQALQTALALLQHRLDNPQAQAVSKTPVTLINTFYPKVGKLAELAELQQAETKKLGTQAKHHGWLGNDIYQSADGASLIIVTRFASEADKAAWQQTEAFQEHLELLNPLLEKVDSKAVEHIASH